MRILHTSDWHLGKRLFKLDRSDEHEKFLEWLLLVLIERDIDVLLIAGDVFDTPTPPHRALSMFYDFLHLVSTETKTETLIIAGNHDSGLLLEAPSRLLTPHRVKVWGKLSSEVDNHWITLKKNGESLEVCAVPFFRSHELLPQGEGDPLAALDRYFQRKKSAPQLLMLHHLAGLYEAGGSEQVIALSGVDSIPQSTIQNFDYVALGHIHKPQKIGPRSYYSGSPIPLRFSETLGKSVVVLEVKNGVLTPEILPIPIIRPLLTIKASEENWREKIKDLSVEGELPPMVEVQLTLTSPRLGLIDEIKRELEKKGMELLSFLPAYISEDKIEHKTTKLFELSTTELFREFYKTKYPEDPDVPEDLMQDFTSLLEKVKYAPSQA